MAANRKINNDARDVKRKLDVISKKCQELGQLGVAIGFAYSSMKTNSLNVFGDKRITRVIEAHKEEILLSSDWMEEEIEITNPSILLAPLPDKLCYLNGLTMKSIIRGILKDTGITWSSPKPTWWPDDIPFQSVTNPPPDYEGKLYVCYKSLN